MTPKQRAMLNAAAVLQRETFYGSDPQQVVDIVNYHARVVRIGRSAAKNAEAVWEAHIEAMYRLGIGYEKGSAPRSVGRARHVGRGKSWSKATCCLWPEAVADLQRGDRRAAATKAERIAQASGKSRTWVAQHLAMDAARRHVGRRRRAA